MWQGKMKALTFSFDDGVSQDIRLISILNKYGLKATFNVNSQLLGLNGCLNRNGVDVTHNKSRPEDIKAIYNGHEVAAHTLTHPTLTFVNDDFEVVRQVEEDRLALSSLVGYEVVGFAFPGGGVNHNSRVEDIVRLQTGCKYARTTDSTFSFDFPRDLFRLDPTVSFINTDLMFELGERFIDLQPEKAALFYIWGHSYELDAWDFWERFEEFCRMMGGRDDIFYGTNKEILCHHIQ